MTLGWKVFVEFQDVITRVLASSPIAYWLLSEVSGTVADDATDTTAHDGAYSSGIALGAVATVNDDVAPTFSSDTVNVMNATFAAAFDGTELTVATLLRRLAWL